jgi:hypothetical protein
MGGHPPFAGQPPPVHRGDSGEGGDLVAVDPAELGQFGNQGAGDDLTNCRAAAFRH